MVFSSAVFLWLFFPIVFLINLILPRKCSNIFLLIASLIFYAWGEPVYVFLMMGTIIVNWAVGVAIDKNRDRSRFFLTAGIIFDVAVLGYFKYSGFAVNTINRILGQEYISVKEIALPIGISFFTFQAMSYIVDVYRKDTRASGNIVNVALYIAYFPQLIAGPIVKYKEINEQIENRFISNEQVAIGFRRFIYGLSKKVIISNVLGKSVDIIFNLGMDSIGIKTAWLGAVMYTFQIYYDFSGYSDMAIGLGKMFGFNIPENFDLPYLSKSISEFWRRWHISLGSWFREYVYIPLGGNRKGKNRTLINLAIVFLLTGMWHGASFSFIFWGVWHGFFIIVERIALNRILGKSRVLSHVYTMLVVVFGWVIFRVNDLARAILYIGKMLSVWRIKAGDIACGNYMNVTTWFVLVLAVLGCGIIQNVIPVKFRDKWKFSTVESIYCIVILVLSISCLVGDTYNPFIYFQF